MTAVGRASFWRDRPPQLRATEAESRQAHIEALHRAAEAVGGTVQGNSIVIEPGPPVEERESMVYFIGGDVGAIKIGVSVDPRARLKGLQIGSPIPLHIMATTPGNTAAELEYHARFGASRLHGEWFERTAELLAEIERLAR